MKYPLSTPVVHGQSKWGTGKLYFGWLTEDELGKNWGDASNREIFDWLTGRHLEYFHLTDVRAKGMRHVFGIGSILSYVNCNSIVYGSGFISSDSSVECEPYEIRAVRGIHTRKRLLDFGVECPEIYGDPALLLPAHYSPKLEKRYRWGFIPHYVDKRAPLARRLSESQGVLILDVLGPFYSFIDQICMCERIASSSLHGLVAADAYRVPSVWVQLGNNVAGGGFKFRDYLETVGRTQLEPRSCDIDTHLSDLEGSLSNGRISLDLDPLLDSCPFVIPRLNMIKEYLHVHYEH